MGYFALIDVVYQDARLGRTETRDANVPEDWITNIAPTTGFGDKDYGPDGGHFTRTWACFFGIYLASLVLSLAFNTVKNKNTAPHEDKILGALIITLVITGINQFSSIFGCGYNPAITWTYIQFETSQASDPNKVRWASALNHYLWTYIIASVGGAAFGGFLHRIHQKCVAKDGSADEGDFVDEIENAH